jgi:AcrR family transcriptional regulator|tara:strand:+ start:1198 stop:1869 length:672 start_codon:yes stop_codon:yes gene_type:complete
MKLVKRKKSKGPGRPSKALAQDRDSREQLLAVAAKLFARYGYDGVTTVAIAKAVGVRQSMIHYHFKSKALLWEETIHYIMRRRKAVFPINDPVIATLPPVERAKTHIRLLFDASIKEPEYGRIFQYEAIVRGDRFKWLMDQYVRRSVAIIDRTIAEAVESGELRDLPVEHLTAIISVPRYLSIVFEAVVSDIHKIDAPAHEYMAGLCETYIDVLFNGMLKRPG